MADLNPLIRIRKYTIDQKQKFLAELYRQAEELARQKEALERQLREEQERVIDMGAQMHGFFANYSTAVRERIEDIIESRGKLEKRILAAQDDLREAFSELKKIEMVEEQRLEEEKRILDKKNSDLMDDIAIEGYRRKQEEAD